MIAVKEMSMPKYCNDCDFVIDSMGYCERANEQIPNYDFYSETNERPSNCPLVEIGTCKDCKYNVKDKRTTTMCDIGHRFFMREPSTFYCADYEKRGNEE